MEERTLTVEFNITGLDADQQQMLQHQILTAVIMGTHLLGVDAPNTMCGEDGKVSSQVTCTLDPPLEEVIPGSVMTDALTGVLYGVVLELDAEEMLIEVTGTKGNVQAKEPRVGERVWAKRGAWKPTGTYYVANQSSDEGVYPMGMRGGKVVARHPGGQMERVMKAGFAGQLT